MQLTSHTDYALRLLIYLFLHEEEQVSAGEVAQSYHISTNHMSKIAGELARLGWVESRRGRGGGLRLLPEGKSLTVGDVVRSLEHNMNLVECFGQNSACALEPACRLKGVLRQARNAFLEVLDGYPLHVLVHNPDTLRMLLAQAQDSS